MDIRINHVGAYRHQQEVTQIWSYGPCIFLSMRYQTLSFYISLIIRLIPHAFIILRDKGEVHTVGIHSGFKVKHQLHKRLIWFSLIRKGHVSHQKANRPYFPDTLSYLIH